MKKAKMLPSIIMLVLCVGVLSMGVYAAMPISHSINGTISVTAAGAEVAITAYLDNSGLGDDTVMSDVITTRNNSTIQLTQDIEFNCESVSVGEQDKVPSKKLYLEIQNKSSIALGAYFYDTDSNLASTGTTIANIATTKNLTGKKANNAEVPNVVTADFSGYTQIPVGGTVKMYCILTLNQVNSEAITVALTEKVNLNVEPYNSKLITEPSTTNTINFTNADSLAVQVACNKTTASVTTNETLNTEKTNATRVALGNLSWNAGAASFNTDTWSEELRLQPVKLKMQVKNNDTVPVKVTVSAGTGNVAQSASISVSTIGNNYIAPGTTEEIWVQFAAVVDRTTAVTSLTGYAIANYNFNVAIEKSTESGTIEIKDDANNAEANRSYLYAQGYRYYVEMGENPYSTTTPKAKLRWYIWAEDDGNGSPKALTSTPTTGDGNIYYFISEYTLDEGNTQTDGSYSDYFGISFQNEYDNINPLGQYATMWTGSNLRNYLNGNTVRRAEKAYSEGTQFKSDGLNVNFYETFKLTESPIFNQIIGRSVDELYSSDSGYASNSGEFDTRFAGQADKFWALSYNEYYTAIVGTSWNYDRAISYQLSGGTETKTSSSWWLRSPIMSCFEHYVFDNGDYSGYDVYGSRIGSRPAFKIQI